MRRVRARTRDERGAPSTKQVLRLAASRRQARESARLWLAAKRFLHDLFSQNAGAEAPGALVLVAANLAGRFFATGAVRTVAARRGVHLADNLRVAGGGAVVIAVEIVIRADVA